MGILIFVYLIVLLSKSCFNSCTKWELHAGTKTVVFFSSHETNSSCYQPWDGSEQLGNKPIFQWIFYCWCFWAAVCWLQSMHVYTPLYNQHTVLLKQWDTCLLCILTLLAAYKMFILYVPMYLLGGISNTSYVLMLPHSNRFLLVLQFLQW